MAAFAHTLSVSTVVSGATTAVLFAPEHAVGERTGLPLPWIPRNSDQTAIEFIRLVLAAEAAPVPRREIVVPLFDNKIVDEKRKENRDE